MWKAKREATEEEKNDPDESRRKTDDDYVQEYKKEKERLANKLDNNTSQGKQRAKSFLPVTHQSIFILIKFFNFTVNIGIVIESSLESTFQVM